MSPGHRHISHVAIFTLIGFAVHASPSDEEARATLQRLSGAQAAPAAATPETESAIEADVTGSTGQDQRTPDELTGLEAFGQRLFSGAANFIGKPSLRLFQPNARIYFDSGDDDEGEADIFDDGSLVPVITLAEVRFTNYIFSETAKVDTEGSIKYDFENRSPWSWGFATGLGATVAADSGEDSTAPVVLVSAGMFLEYDLRGLGLSGQDYEDWTQSARTLGLPSSGPTVGLEAGWVYGISADENFDDNDDSAWYVGVTVYVPF